MPIKKGRLDKLIERAKADITANRVKPLDQVLTTRRFLGSVCRFTTKNKSTSEKSLPTLEENQFHPSLHFKKVTDNLWSARITANPKVL